MCSFLRPVVQSLLIRTLLSCGILLLLSSVAIAQARLTDDAFTSSAKPSSNFDKAGFILVSSGSPGPTQIGYVRFDLDSTLPVGTSGSQVAKATLTLFVDNLSPKGQFNVARVVGNWSESTLTFSNPPSLGIVEASNVSSGSFTEFVSVDVTNAVRAWLDGVPNHGFALVPASTNTNISFDGKENPLTSHEPRLTIELAGPEGERGPTGPQGPQGPQGVPGSGTVQSVIAGQGLSGGGTGPVVTLSVDGGSITNVNATSLGGKGLSYFPKLQGGNNLKGDQAIGSQIFLRPEVATVPDGHWSGGINFVAQSNDPAFGTVDFLMGWRSEPISGTLSSGPSARLRFMSQMGNFPSLDCPPDDGTILTPCIASPNKTSLWINPDGTINFEPGQVFPGTVTGSAGSGLTTTGNTVSLDTAFTDLRYAQLAAPNIFTQNQKIIGDLALTGSGNITGFSAFFDGVGGGVIGRDRSASGTSNFGIGGYSDATSGLAFGTYGQSQSPQGNGVRGVNLATTGGSGVIGIYGNNLNGTPNPAATAGVGVRGFNQASGGYGVQGQATSSANFTVGVRGEASATTGVTRGVEGVNSSQSGSGVRGHATALTGTSPGTPASNIGVVGRSDGDNGVGVFAQATSSSGAFPKNAVRAQTAGPNSAAVLAEAFSTTGLAHGVQAFAASSGDFTAAVQAEAQATSGLTYGVRGLNASTNGSGVSGENTATSGFNFGLRGSASSGDGTGVLGEANATTGITNGVRGVVHSAAGIAGKFENDAGGTVILGVGPGGNPVFRVGGNGSVFADGSYNCGLTAGICFNGGIGADVAERIDTTELLLPGDVVEIDPDSMNHFRKVRTAHSTMAAGIISTLPGMALANNDLHGNDGLARKDSRPLLALVGRVPVNVTDEAGAIRVGDLLTTSSTPGFAMRCEDRLKCAGAIVGKAMAPLPSGKGQVMALVTLQ